MAAQAPPEAEPATTAPALPGIRLGPFILQPRFDFSGIGWDSNVFLAGDRSGPARNDLYASGGPGLGVTLPFTPKFRLVTDSRLNYFWYAKTAEQRRLNGSAFADLRFDANPVQVSLGYGYEKTFERPSPEVGRRVEVEQAGPRATVAVSRQLGSGRIKLGLGGGVQATSSPSGAREDFFGNDLGRRLTRTSWEVKPSLSYALTAKTELVLAPSYRYEKFERESTLDAATYGWSGGVRTDDTTLLPGEVLLGMERYDPRDPSTPPRDSLTATIRLRLALTPKTRLEPSYQRARAVSLLRTVGETQTVVRDDLGLQIHKEVTARIDLRLRAARAASVTDGGGVIIDFGDGSEQVFRDEVQYLAEGDLGYRFGQLRVGIVGSWRNRARTAFAEGRVEGFTLGLSASFLYRP